MGDFDLSLINEFRNRPSFYDRNSSRFKDKLYNAQQWQEISNKLGFDVSIIKDRMLQLRNRYNLEKRRLEQFHEENPGNSIESPWPLYEHLHFLSDHIRARRSYKKMLPLPYQQQSLLSSPSEQQTSSQQQIIDRRGHTEDHISYRNERHNSGRHNNSRTATNHVTFPGSLLRVKIEENNTDDSDEATEYRSNDMESYTFEPSAILSVSQNVHSSSSSTSQQQQQLQQQQQQHHHQQPQEPQQQRQRYYSKDVEILEDSITLGTSSARKTTGTAIKSTATNQLPSISIKRLESLRSAAPTMVNNIPNKKRAASTSVVHHNQQEQWRNNSVNLNTTAVNSSTLPCRNRIMIQPSSIGGRNSTYIAFSNFVTSSLLDLPQNIALELINNFTKDIVNALIEKSAANAPKNTDTSTNNLMT